MKRSFEVFVLVVLIITMITACDESFLDIKPETTRNSETAFVTAEDVELAVIGCYEPLVNRRFDGGFVTIPAGHGLFQADFLFMADARSDNSYPPLSGLDDFWNYRWMDLPRFRINTSNSLVADTYFKCYQGIGACNKVLENIDNIELDSTKYNQYKGEVLFLRGFYYYHLVRNFGAVPITDGFVSTPDEAFETAVARVPVDRVYEEAVVPDLTLAAELLPQQSSYSNEELGRVGKGTAYGMLGKVEADRLNWQGAKEAIDDLLALNEYRLEANFSDIFAGENANKKNGETLFEAQNYGPVSGTEGRYATWSTFYETCVPSTLLKNNFYGGDLRLDATIGQRGSPARDAFIKYPQFQQTVILEGIYDGDNVIILRLADLYLLYAEAENELNGPTASAISYLNQIHAHPRTGLSPLVLGVDFNTQDELRRLIARERQIELAFEGHRWYDLLRYERAWQGSTTTNNPENSVLVDFMNEFNASITVEDIPFQYPRDLLYPIPEIEVAVSGVEQNPGAW